MQTVRRGNFERVPMVPVQIDEFTCNSHGSLDPPDSPSASPGARFRGAAPAVRLSS
jgi:hypothetical protein